MIEIQSSFKYEAIVPVVGFSLPNETDDTCTIVIPFIKNGTQDQLIINVSNRDIPDDCETIKAMTIIGIAGFTCLRQNSIYLFPIEARSDLICWKKTT